MYHARAKLIRVNRKKIVFAIIAIIVFVVFSFETIFVSKAHAAVGINHQINFQGKLVNSNGTNVADGLYDIVFKIYTVSSGGVAVWTETRTGANQVTVNQGIFRVSLGSVTTLPGSVDFGTDNIYLGITVGADSEMTPRVQFASVPQAFNAEKVNGLTVTNTLNNPFSTATTLKIADGKTFVVNNGLTFTGTDTTSFTFPSTGGNIVTEDFTQTLTNKTIGSTGLTFSGATTDITTATNEHLNIAPAGTGKVGINTSAPLASFDVRPNGAAGGTIAVASVSGSTSFAGLVIDNSGVGDIFAASKSGAVKFVIENSGNIKVAANQTIDTLTSGTLGIGTTNATTLSIGRSGQGITFAGFDCSALGNGGKLTTTSGGILTCSADTSGTGGGGGSNWTLSTVNGTLSPNNNTLDLLLGGVATSSAKFAFLNMNGSASPIASVSATTASGGNGNGIKIGGDGTIQSLRNNTLTIGGNTTGEIAFNPGNASTPSLYLQTGGNVGIGTTTPADKLEVSGGNLRISNTAPTLIFNQTAGVAWQYSINGDQWLVQRAGVDKFVVNNAGDIIFKGTLTNNASTDVRIGATAINSNLYLQSNGTDFIKLTSLGQLGLGTQLGPSGGNLTAKLQVYSDLGTLPAASVSGSTSFAGLVIDNSGVGDLFTASTAGLTRFIITNNGTASSSAGFTLDGAGGNIQSTKNQSLIIGGGSTGELTIGRTTQRVFLPGFDCSALGNGGKLTTTSGGILACSADTSGGGSGSSNWVLNSTNGTLSPINNTLDFLLGGTSTTSAKFAVLNINNGTPTASVSAGTAGGAYMTANGTIATTARQTLTLGNSTTTGEILINAGNGPNNGTGYDLTLSAGGAGGISGNGGTMTISGGYGGASGTSGILTLNGSSTSTPGTINIGTNNSLTATINIGNTSGSYNSNINLNTANSGSIFLTPNGSGSTTITADYNTGLNVGSSANTPAPLSVSGGIGNNAAFILNKTNSGDIFAASASGVTKFTIKSDGTASMSGNLVLDSAGSLQTTNSQTLTLGGNTTGSIQFKPGNLSNPALFIRSNGDIGIGPGNTSPLATLDVRVNTANAGGTQAIASVSGTTSFAGLIVDNSGRGDLFTASSSGLTRFTVRQNGIVQVGSTTNGLTFDYLNGGPTYTGTGRPTKSITLSPEYAGAVLTASNSATTNGSMTSDASHSANFRTYYEWTSTQNAIQDYTVAVRVTLPSDFSDWATGNAMTIAYQNAFSSSTANKVDVYIYLASDTSGNPVYFSTGNVSTTWATINLTKGQLNNSHSTDWGTAGQTAIIYLKMYASGTVNYTHVGDITLNYLSKF